MPPPLGSLCCLWSQTVNLVLGPYFLKVWPWQVTLPLCASVSSYIKFRFLIFIKFRFLSSIPKDSHLAGLGAGIRLLNQPSGRIWCWDPVGYNLGKAELRVSCVCITAWLVPAVWPWIDHFLCFCFLPCQIGIEIPTSLVAEKMRTHVGKAPQEMGTCLLHCCSLGVRDCAKHFMALSYCIIAAILWYPCTNVIPILQMRKLAPPYHHCFGPDLLFQKQVTLSLLNPGSRYCQTWPGWSLWNWTPGQECNPFVSRNLMRLMRFAVWVPLRF